MKLLIFFPTYNEAGNVASLLCQITLTRPDADILIVDDGSDDGTRDILAGVGNEKIKLLVRPGKFGIGTAHLLAWCHALHHGYDVLVTMDADHSHDPAEIPKLLAKLDGGCDLVIGSRYMPGARCDYTGYRRWVSRTANVATRLLLRIDLSEFTTSFRAFRIDKLANIDFANLLVDGYSFFFMTMVQANAHGLRIAEVPIHFHNRQAGRSKIPATEIFRGVQNLIRLVATRYRGARSVDARNALHGCKACGCAYSKLILPVGASPKDVGADAATAEFCVFCGDTGGDTHIPYGRIGTQAGT